MTSIPEVPGAEAVILNHDELHDDDNHMESTYYRIKILSEGGIRHGDVELQFNKRRDSNGYSVGDIAGRTIQPDGTIVPFTGKPYDKLLHKDKENAYTARVFSLPAVQVGSIVEYRYTLRWDDHTFFFPAWNIQTDLYLRKGHFHWKPTDKELSGTTRGGRETLANRLTWSSSLPKGVEPKMIRLPTGKLDVSMDVAEVPPFSREDYMPPIASSRFHVFFYYTQYSSPQEFWNTEVKFWNTDTGKFTRTNGYVQGEAQAAIAGATTDEDKARKLYLAAMKLENTDYTRPAHLAGREGRDQVRRRRAEAQARQQSADHHGLRGDGARRGTAGLCDGRRRSRLQDLRFQLARLQFAADRLHCGGEVRRRGPLS